MQLTGLALLGSNYSFKGNKNARIFVPGELHIEVQFLERKWGQVP